MRTKNRPRKVTLWAIASDDKRLRDLIDKCPLTSKTDFPNVGQDGLTGYGFLKADEAKLVILAARINGIRCDSVITKGEADMETNRFHALVSYEWDPDDWMEVFTEEDYREAVEHGMDEPKLVSKPQYMYCQEASNKTGVSYNEIRRLCDLGKVDSIKVGSTGKFTMVDYNSLVTYLAKKE